LSDEMSGLVWKRFPGKGGELIVMLALADWSNDNGHAYGKMTTLGRKSRMTKRNAQLVVDQLEAKKWVRVIRPAVNGWANDFYINKKKLESMPLVASQEDEEQIPRVKNFHPSKQSRMRFLQKGEKCGKRRVKNSTNMGEIVEKNQEKISPHVMT